MSQGVTMTVAMIRPLQRPVPLRQSVYDALIDLIVGGELPPGQHMVETDLAHQLGVSRQPIREALHRMEAEGWVDLRPSQGAFVHVPTDSEVDDLLDVRALLEAETGRLAAARRVTPAQLARLREICRDGEAAAEAGDFGAAVAANNAFHAEVAAVGGNAVLAELADIVGRRVQWYYRMVAPERGHGSWAEHAEMIEAIEAGDADRAQVLARKHTERTRLAYHRALFNGSEYLDEAQRRLQRHARGEQLLDDVIVKVPGDPLPVFDERDLLAVAARALELESQPSLGGERLCDGQIPLAEPGAAIAADQDDRSVEVRASHDRDAEDGPIRHGLWDLDARAVAPMFGLPVLSGVEHRRDERGVGVDGAADHLRAGPRACQHEDAAWLPTADHDRLGADDFGGALADQHQRVGEVGVRQQCEANVRRCKVLALKALLFGEEPPQLVLGPLALGHVAHRRDDELDAGARDRSEADVDRELHTVETSPDEG